MYYEARRLIFIEVSTRLRNCKFVTFALKQLNVTHVSWL